MVYIENKEKNKVLELQIGDSSYDNYYDTGEYEDYHYSGDEINGDDEDFYEDGDKLIGLIEADFVEDNPNQLWKKAKPDGETEGYFFLGSSEDTDKVLSATSASALEIRGM